ncbi:2,3-butanediol dehydrogenase [Mycobacterium sp. 050128]|uniref:2,3-butanediol dehydrogenase n=1 Tax=Mycobacterium TaxID=1763 RepID=UPI00044A1371|nr:2,3-butanediol dehydrogenase [Mycobacterium intracellulare]ARV80157.1 zinc-binding alcohol dehydrogenase [Mycobacterium intracellulare subsp. chimaera]ETZ36024.1 zinc-binding dehydrogenase family protein [Mycobacterium intracellulare MIN_052511_1280]KPN47657.1 zinc-binding alcohol dehydrogenase [Mycobacterium intracellulare subsp. chimaera]KPN48975.1 zinc-binding alcohol dehydrogenase [Mycobacterium intracellulare subsp. chimaera]MDM3909156.1 2,3-butanediol dehydrogenase [Mycobacterium intr
MRAAVYHGSEDVRIEELPDPAPRAGEVAIEVARAGICGTDLHEYTAGPMHAAPGVIMGHEYSGTVVGIGPGVHDFTEGDRVCGVGVFGCGECGPCKQGAEALCATVGFIGFNVNGALARYVSLPTKALFHIPDEVSLVEAAVVEPIASAYHAVRRSRLTAGETVFIAGAGPIGLALAQFSHAQGASQIIVTEISPTRRAAAQQSGATRVIDPLLEDAAEMVRTLTDGHGVDVSFDAAGVQPALDATLGVLRPRGRLVVVAIWEAPANVDINRNIMREAEIGFSFCYEAQWQVPEILSLIAKRAIYPDQLVTDEIPMDAVVSQGFEELRSNRDAHMKILIDPSL